MVQTEVILDERIFTVNCALNLCEHDRGIEGKPLPITKRMRKKLQEKKIRNKKEICEKINSYPISHLKSFSAYLSNPPELKLEKKPPGITNYMEEIYRNIKGIEKELRTIYKEADLSEIWEENKETYQKYREIFENSINKYKPVERLIDFLQIDTDLEKIQCAPAVLERMSLGVPVSEEEAFMIIGVPGNESESGFSFGLRHELIHLFLKPFIQENEELIQQSAWRREEAPDKHFYQSWRVYLEEIIARVIGVHLYHSDLNQRRKQIKNLKEKKGFVHSELISKEISRYEDKDESFEEFLPEILEKLAQKEKQFV